MKKILYLINDLEKGGAETNLFQIIKYSNKNLFYSVIVSLTGKGFFYNELLKIGANVVALDFKKHPLKTILTIKKMARSFDVLSCWMYHANAIGYFSTKRLSNLKVIWNIRHSNIDKKYEKRSTFLLNKYCRNVSKKIDLIVYNGLSSQLAHERFGYFKGNSIVLNNGCDVSLFSGISDGYLRKTYKIDNSIPIIISVGRNHVIKDPITFINLLSYLKSQRFRFKSFMCGLGFDNDNIAFIDQCLERGIDVGDDLCLLGQRNDVESLLAESDFFILHSKSEAFPNVLIQAMASRCVCISTNVGEASAILGNNTFVTNVGDYKSMGDIIIKLWNSPKSKIDNIKDANRARVVEHYNIMSIVEDYERLL